MNVFNIRMGFATNSSSSHSIVYMKNPITEDSGDCNHEYGWDNFTLTAESSKRDYMAMLLSYSIRPDPERGVTHEMAAQVIRDLTGATIPTNPDPEGGYWGADRAFDGYIDHDSVGYFPFDLTGRGINEEFTREMINFVAKNPHIVILGGNDNDGGHPYAVPEPWDYTDDEDDEMGLVEAHGISKLNLGLGGFSYHGNTSVRRDSAGYWVLFNKTTGTKVRMNLSDPNGHPLATPTKADVPELVDLKITDWCDVGCAFCYQGSTTKGKHASLARVDEIAAALAEAGVFEVAIGGGEPTDHPQFIEILKAFRSRGVVPNFTTKKLGWLGDIPRAMEIIRQIGAFAYSVDYASQVKDLNDAVNHYNNRVIDLQSVDASQARARETRLNAYGDKTATVQHVVGAVSSEDFSEVLQMVGETGLSITLLGYKTTGRGSRYTPHEFNWLELFHEYQNSTTDGTTGMIHRLGIDTVLAATVQEDAVRAQLTSPQVDFIDERLLTVDDGTFSMYIDAVTNRWGPSSYEPQRMQHIPASGQFTPQMEELMGRGNKGPLVDYLIENGGPLAFSLRAAFATW